MTKRSERGSTLLFIAIGIIPLLFFAFTLSIGFVSTISDQKKTQEELSRAATIAARRLPIIPDAEAAARQYLSLTAPTIFGRSGENAVVSFTKGNLFLGAKYKTENVFGSLLTTFFGQGVKDVPVAEWVRAQVTPFDVFVALDASHYMSPSISDTKIWGYASDWPDAQLLRAASPLPLIVPSTGKRPAPGIATQQCWNPIFSSLKLATLHTYNYFANFPLDQVGIGVFPGVDTSMDILRTVQTRDSEGAGSAGTPAEAAFTTFKGDAKADYFCAAASERETASRQYQLPPTAPKLSLWKAPSGAPAYMTVPPYYNFDPAYAPYASVQRAVWNVATRDRTPDFAQVVLTGMNQLIQAPKVDDRGASDAQVTKTLFILSGSFPYLNGKVWKHSDPETDGALRDVLRSVRTYVMNDLAPLDIHLRVVYVFAANINQYISEDFIDWPYLDQTFKEELTPDEESKKRLYAQVAIGPADYAASLIVPALLGGERSVVLSEAG